MKIDRAIEILEKQHGGDYSISQIEDAVIVSINALRVMGLILEGVNTVPKITVEIDVQSMKELAANEHINGNDKILWELIKGESANED